MIKSYKRALRRHHVNRLKQKRRIHWGRVLHTDEELGKAVGTPKPCSCFMCGNPRKYYGEKTVQERRFEQVPILILK